MDPDGVSPTVSPRSASVLFLLKAFSFWVEIRSGVFFDCKWKQTSEVSQFIYICVYFLQDFIFRILDRITKRKTNVKMIAFKIHELIS